MHSSLIGKIEKANRYARERDRISIAQMKVHFRGEHDSYEIIYDNGAWKCSCNFFAGWKVCSHTMALQKIMGEMLPKGPNNQEELVNSAPPPLAR